MQPGWADEHSQALGEYLAQGMSFAQIARAINARFDTSYSRNAAIGRAARMGLACPERPDRPRASPKPRPQPRHKLRIRVLAEPRKPRRLRERAAALHLRCVGIVPRHLALIELEAGDCRYPYGGDVEGEAITFCGHPKTAGASYCASHVRLTHRSDGASDRAAARVLLRLVEAA
jgi:GcrA cell cycle regulator